MISENETIRLKGGAEVSVDWSTRTNCKLCKREIYWTQTMNGKMMPINVIAPKFEGDMAEWESHFASCPNAQNFRKLTEEQEQMVGEFRKEFRGGLRQYNPEIGFEGFKDLTNCVERFWIAKMVEQKNELKARYKAGLRNLAELVENKTKKELLKTFRKKIEEMGYPKEVWSQEQCEGWDGFKTKIIKAIKDI